MIVIIIIIFAFLLLLLRAKITNFILRNMVLIFLAFWGGSLLLSILNPYGLYEVSYGTYFLLITFVACFCIGIYSNAKSYQIAINYSDINLNVFIDRLINNKVILLIIILLNAFLLYLYIKEQAILATYSVAEVRINIDELLYEGNSFLGITRNLLIIPITPILMFLGSYMLMYNRKHVFPLCMLLFFMVISSLLGGSRGGIFKIAIYCFFMIICKKIFNPARKKISFFPLVLKFTPILLVVLIIMSNMTAQREFDMRGFTWEGVCIGFESLSKHFVTYCIGPFRALDYSFQNDYISMVGGYKYGQCTLGFIDGLISLFLNFIGIGYEPGYRKLATLVQDNWIIIGGGESFNFAYTAILFYYVDLGILGVIIFPFFLGRCIASIANKFWVNRNPMLLVALAYMFTIMIDTIFTWRLYRHHASITFIIIFLLYLWYKKRYIVSVQK